MTVFKPTEYIDSIYYADLFKINGKMCMLTGYGKSVAAKIASNNESEADLGRDGVALINRGRDLYGRHDIGLISAKIPENPFPFHKIEKIVHSLSEKQTNQLFNNNKEQPIPILVDNKTIANEICKIPYPALALESLISKEDYIKLINPERRYEKFIELTNNIESIKFYLMPHMKMVEYKASLYQIITHKDYIHV